MSIRRVKPGPGQPDIIVRKGKPLNTDICPACGGTTVAETNSKGQKIQRCTRCRAEVTSTKF